MLSEIQTSSLAPPPHSEHLLPNNDIWLGAVWGTNSVLEQTLTFRVYHLGISDICLSHWISKRPGHAPLPSHVFKNHPPSHAARWFFASSLGFSVTSGLPCRCASASICVLRDRANTEFLSLTWSRMQRCAGCLRPLCRHLLPRLATPVPTSDPETSACQKKTYILHDSVHMKCSEQENPMRQKEDFWLLRAWWDLEMGDRQMSTGVSFWGEENILKLTAVMVVHTWIY